MRIISGLLKGRSINFLKNSKTRPLKDSVKESIFNILKHSKISETKIESSSVLDLYSGIGSFGIECISRGAKYVTFIEEDINATNILKDNLAKFSISEKASIYIDKVENVLDKNINKKFNIFFLDPLFADNYFLKVLEIVKKKNIFSKKNFVIIHRERKSQDNFKDFFNVVDTKQYGRSKIIFGIFK